MSYPILHYRRAASELGVMEGILPRLDSANETTTDQVAELVAAGCPGAKLEEAEPPCMTMTIPQKGVALADIFAHLAKLRQQCGVQEISLSQCTLEQIFLQMASKQQLREGATES